MAEGAGTGNFALEPQRVGWYAGDEAHFVLSITPNLVRSSPEFVIDRHFAIEEIRFDEAGVTFGGDFETKDPNAVALRLSRDNLTAEEFTLAPDTPALDVHVTIPQELRDSEYVLELKLFKVGWVESGKFRVDHR